MIIYKDAVTGDELFTDSYKIELVDDLYYRIHGKFVSESDDESQYNIGANPSAEEQAEALDQVSVTGIDVCLQNRLVAADMTKSSYKKHIAEFSKKLLARVPAERAAFLKAQMQPAVVKFLKEFDDYSLYVGESCGDGGVVILCKFEGDGNIGCKVSVYVWKDAVIEEKS